VLHCWFILVQRPLAWRIYVMSIFILVFLLAISPRPLNRSSPNLPVRWQIGNNKKLSFWFLNSFGCWREVQIGHFRFGRSFTKCNMASKRSYWSKKTAVRFWLGIYSVTGCVLNSTRGWLTPCQINFMNAVPLS